MPRCPGLVLYWRVRVTERGLFHETVAEQALTAITTRFDGKPAYGISGPEGVTVLDPITFNTLGTLKDGKVVTSYAPATGPFSWPLWGGKAWTAAYQYTGLSYGRTWLAAWADTKVAAFEPITVPAGTFQAVRIECAGGIGTHTTGGRHGDSSTSGIQSDDICWYAPAVQLIVRSVVNRSGTHFRGAGQTVTELVTPPYLSPAPSRSRPRA